MDSIKDWFTVDNVKSLSTAAIAVRIVVEYSKSIFDALWQRTTGLKPYTFLYALAWSAFVVYGIMGGDWRVNVFNAFLLAVLSGVMEKPAKS